jgi:hypothetical protein
MRQVEHGRFSVPSQAWRTFSAWTASETQQGIRVPVRGDWAPKIDHMTAKERLLREAPQWTDAQATAALRVVAAHAALASYLDDESKLSAEEHNARGDNWAEASAREAIHEEPW